MDRKAYKVLSSVKRTELSKMGGTLTTPTAPQMTDVSPNRWGEPPCREEVRKSNGIAEKRAREALRLGAEILLLCPEDKVPQLHPFP
jgi:hypothetical protein